MGELLPSAQFYAFDVPVFRSGDVRGLPLRDRLDLLRAFPHPVPRCGNGGEFLRAIMESGGEGIVAKPIGSAYGNGWLKAKRREVFYCIVAELDRDGRQCARLAFVPFQDVKNLAVSRREKLETAGWLKIAADKLNRVRVGSILKIEAFGRHKSGLLREARLDQDAPGSWLVQY